MSKGIASLASVIIAVLCVTAIFVFPFTWAISLFPTQAHSTVTNMAVTSSEESVDGLTKAVTIGDSTALGQGAETIEGSFSYQYLESLSTDNQLNSSRYSNLAITGATIEDVLDSQLEKAIELEPDLIFISIGANDVTGMTSKVDFTSRIETLESKLESLNIRVIWLSIPDFISVPILSPQLRLATSLRALDFNTVIYDSCAAIDRCSYIDVYDYTRKAFLFEPLKHYAKDLYHPSAAGYKLWSQAIQDQI